MKNKKILIIGVVLIIILVAILINRITTKKVNSDITENNIEYKVNEEDTNKYDIYENGVVTKTIEKEMLQFYQDNPDFNPQLPIETN